MTDQHPITPPPELAAEWVAEIYGNTVVIPLQQPTLDVITRAAQWGADQELEACCELLKQKGVPAWSLLRSHRRPKPPSLKEQALEEVGAFEGMGTCNIDIIRRALEALPND